MKISTISALAAISLTAACATQMPGAGEMSNGEPISVFMDASMAQAIIDIESPDGWKCQANLADADTSRPASVRHSFPMKCSDGVTGNMLLTMGGPDKIWRGAFKLSNGRSGQFSISLKPPI